MVQMLSSLTFKQENTIADEPMVDLLKYLNNMLDDAVANARLSSGHNPLQQLVLIIADGRFHEKVPRLMRLKSKLLAFFQLFKPLIIFPNLNFLCQENLKRYVRDILSKKRMVAFLLLDSPQESIMDLMVPADSNFYINHILFSFFSTRQIL